jgi:hypothetical protein
MDLLTIINANVNKLFKVTQRSTGTTYKYNSTVGNRALMYDTDKTFGLYENDWDLWVQPLDLQKEGRKQAIDAKTGQIIACGFEFDSYCFSLSDNAQNNWNRVENKYNGGTLVYPHSITAKTAEGDVVNYDLTNDEQLLAFMTIVDNAVDFAVDTGRTYVIQIQEAITQAELDAIVDNRTIQPYS